MDKLPQATPAAEPQTSAATPPNPSAPAASAPETPVKPAFNPADFENLTKQFEEASAKLKAFEEAEAAKAEAQLSEVERYKQKATKSETDLTQLRQQIEQMAVRHAFDLSAKDLGCLDADLAFSALDRSKIKSVNGKTEGMAVAIQALVEAKPFLFNPPAQHSGAGGQPPDRGVKQNPTPHEVLNMNPQQFREFQKLVRAKKIR